MIAILYKNTHLKRLFHQLSYKIHRSSHASCFVPALDQSAHKERSSATPELNAESNLLDDLPADEGGEQFNPEGGADEGGADGLERNSADIEEMEEEEEENVE